MKRIALLLAIITAIATTGARAQSPADTCRVFMQLYDYTYAPARYVTLQVKRLVVNGVNVALPEKTGNPQSDANGVVQFRAIKNSTVWLYAPVVGLDSDAVKGRPIPIGNQLQQWIVPTTASAVPPRHMVAVGQMMIGKDALSPGDSLFIQGAGVVHSVLFGAHTFTITGGTGVDQPARDTASNANRNAATALTKAAAAQGTANTAQSAAGTAQTQADIATYRTEHDSTITTDQSYDATDMNVAHPRFYVFTDQGIGLSLPSATIVPDGTRFTVKNEGPGDITINYQPGEDPDASGTDQDTIAQTHWRTIVATTSAWRVITAIPGPAGPQGATGPQGPQGIPGTTPSLAAYKDTATRNSQTQVITAHTPFKIGPQIVVNTMSNLFEWQPWDSLAVFSKWCMNLITQNGAAVPNDDGYSSQSLSLGRNPNGVYGTGARKWGMWLKMEDYYNHGYSAPPRGPIMETHFEYLGESGVTRRTMTAYNTTATGRGTNYELGYDTYQWQTGNGVSADADSLLLHAVAPSNNGTYDAGYFGLYAPLDFLRGSYSYPTLVRVKRPDSSATVFPIQPVFLIEDYGGFRLGTGTATQITAANSNYVPYHVVGARQVQRHYDSPYSRITDRAFTIVRETNPAGKGAYEITTNGYVDSIAALRATIAALTDSLNANAVRAEVDPTATAKAGRVVDSSFTSGARSVSSTGRMFAADDSLTLTVAPNETINAALGNVFRLTVTANDTLGIANMIDGQVITVRVINAGTYTLAWTGIAWDSGGAPVLTSGANKRDVFTFVKTGGDIYGGARQGY